MKSSYIVHCSQIHVQLSEDYIDLQDGLSIQKNSTKEDTIWNT